MPKRGSENGSPEAERPEAAKVGEEGAVVSPDAPPPTARFCDVVRFVEPTKREKRKYGLE